MARRGEKNGGGRGWSIWREKFSTQKEGVARVLKGRGIEWAGRKHPEGIVATS